MAFSEILFSTWSKRISENGIENVLVATENIRKWHWKYLGHWKQISENAIENILVAVFCTMDDFLNTLRAGLIQAVRKKQLIWMWLCGWISPLLFALATRQKSQKNVA